MTTLVERITARYELDREAQPRPAVRSDIPTAYDAITSEWLTAVLCDGYPGTRVVSYRLDEADNGSSNRRRIFVTYDEKGTRAGLPSSVFCKASHDLGNRLLLAMSGAARCEVTFYNKIRPQLDIQAPHSFLANYDADSGTSIVMLEDLQRVEFCRHTTPIDRTRAEGIVDLLATLHGKFLRSDSLRSGGFDLVTWPEYWANNISLGMEQYSNRGFLAAEEVIPPRLFKEYPRVWALTMRSVERHRELPQTLTHGDVHLKNWYVAADGSMGLSDWQNTCIGHWSRDFAYAVSTSLTIENRRAWERPLLERYLAKLRETGGDATTFDDAWLNYRQQLFGALAYWTITLTPPDGLPDMQPRDTTLEFIRRMAQAIDDHDSIHSFTEAR